MQKEAREGKRTLLKKDPGLPNLRVLKAKLDNKVFYSIVEDWWWNPYSQNCFKRKQLSSNNIIVLRVVPKLYFSILRFQTMQWIDSKKRQYGNVKCISISDPIDCWHDSWPRWLKRHQRELSNSSKIIFWMYFHYWLFVDTFLEWFENGAYKRRRSCRTDQKSILQAVETSIPIELAFKEG